MDSESLQFKEECDGCGHHLSWIDTAYICNHECTWCTECAEGTGFVCSKCSAELRKRPRRTQPVKR